ncbi:MAG: TrkA family potassium uptake protein [Erysipelotrichaceae bacterium]|nr:TrkA family potassium uptake protein [Erysipelotrichaceae bacterium]
MKKSFAVLGLGRFGTELAKELTALGAEVISIDTDEENVHKVADYVDNCYICDMTNEVGLRELGVQNVEHAIVAIGSNLQSSIISTIILKEFNIPKITVRVDDDYFVPVLKKLGATDVVSPQKLAGINLANKIVSDTFLDYYNLAEDYVIVKMLVNEQFIPQSLIDMKIRNRFDINLLLIERNSSLFLPKGTDEIQPNDILFVFGEKKKVSKFDEFINAL